MLLVLQCAGPPVHCLPQKTSADKALRHTFCLQHLPGSNRVAIIAAPLAIPFGAEVAARVAQVRAAWVPRSSSEEILATGIHADDLFVLCCRLAPSLCIAQHTLAHSRSATGVRGLSVASLST